MEKIYNTMKNVGIWNLVFGVGMIIAGVAVGVMMIISGANLLKKKKELLF